MRSEPRLFHYIRGYRKKNHTWNQIEGYLSQKGYTARDIAEAIADYREAKDLHSEDKLVAYIELHLKKGFTLQQLIDHLLKSKIDPHLVRRAVFRIQPLGKKKPAIEPEPESQEASLSDPNWQDPLIMTAIFTCFVLSFVAEAFIFASFLMLAVLISTVLRQEKTAKILTGVGTLAFVIASIFYQTYFSLAAAGIFFLISLLQTRKEKKKN